MKLWYIIAFFLILTGCNKRERNYIYIPQLYKDVALFQKNSYWVYLNEKTLQVDCTYVKTDPAFHFDSDELTSHEVIIVPFDGNLFIQDDLFDDAVILSSKIQPHFSIIIIQIDVEKLDSLYINKYVYHNVYHTHQSSLTAQSDSIILDTYVVPHIGIIKISKNIAGKDTTISLLRWNVKQ